MSEEDVEPQEEILQEQQPEAPQVEAEGDDKEPVFDNETKTQVPLSALQKERRKRQEAELEAKWWKEKAAKEAPLQEPQEDNSKYETATREEVLKAQEETLRKFEETQWIKNNPEKYEKVNEYLPQFLKQRPNLASAINSSFNRYEEAYTLMEALTPKQQQQLKAPVAKKESPNAPTSVPKAAAMNHAVDVMSMSDSEFHAWRQTQRRKR